ncbi:glyoxalase [Modestobacter caceresii]|uniref:Glyoxalase n=1 Tax=Modestobacter caceresii TaxID=1522368 RepID=A0A098YBP3_9ACTN|nr:VOC family protein [Modestobacter caceresii]KGH47211.1 glyoxalase [Modestobacter caceresii]
MTVAHLLAVVPVTDLHTATAWYERLFGRPPDNRPMPTLAEWRVTDTGWVQVHVDADRPGRALLNLAVDDLAAHLDELRSRGLSPGEVQTASKGVQLASVTDPDGNVVTLIGGFRVVY